MIFDNHTQSKHHARQEAGPPGATNTRRPLTTTAETTVAVANPHFTFHHNRPVPSAERSCAEGHSLCQIRGLGSGRTCDEEIWPCGGGVGV